MEFDFVTVFTIVFMSTILGFVIAFGIHFYRDWKSDEKLFKNRSVIKIEKP
jgi:hypothetical protein